MAMVNAPHPGELLKKLYIKPLELTVGNTAEGLSVMRPILSRIINAQSNYDLDQAKSNAKKIKIKRLYKAA